MLFQSLLLFCSYLLSIVSLYNNLSDYLNLSTFSYCASCSITSVKNHTPKALSPTLVNRIARYLFNGFSDEETSILINLPVQRIRELRAGKYEISVRKCTLELKNKAIERVKSGKGKLNGLIWWLERRYPKEYAKPELQLSLSAPITNQTLVISAEVAEGLLKRSKAVVTEIDQLIADKQPAEVPQ